MFRVELLFQIGELFFVFEFELFLFLLELGANVADFFAVLLQNKSVKENIRNLVDEKTISGADNTLK